MMKCTEKLVLGHATNVGNHSESYDEGSTIEKFFYHGNCVCEVNHSKRTFKLDDCGYGGCNSTIRTLNDYRKHFIGVGYTEIFSNESDMIDYFANQVSEGKMYKCFIEDTEHQVTCTKRFIGNQKFCKITLDFQIPYLVDIEFYYRGVKSFKKAWDNKKPEYNLK